jgi:hypothetical protein
MLQTLQKSQMLQELQTWIDLHGVERCGDLVIVAHVELSRQLKKRRKKTYLITILNEMEEKKKSEKHSFLI